MLDGFTNRGDVLLCLSIPLGNDIFDIQNHQWSTTLTSEDARCESFA